MGNLCGGMQLPNVGAMPKNPLDEEKLKQIKDDAEKVGTTFGKVFALKFKDEYIAMMLAPMNKTFMEVKGPRRMITRHTVPPHTCPLTKGTALAGADGKWPCDNCAKPQDAKVSQRCHETDHKYQICDDCWSHRAEKEFKWAEKKSPVPIKKGMVEYRKGGDKWKKVCLVITGDYDVQIRSDEKTEKVSETISLFGYAAGKHTKYDMDHKKSRQEEEDKKDKKEGGGDGEDGEKKEEEPKEEAKEEAKEEPKKEEKEDKDKDCPGVEMDHYHRGFFHFYVQKSEDRDAWFDAMNEACARCKSLANADAVMAKAFEAALIATKHELDIKGPAIVDGTEIECISWLCKELIHKDVLKDVLAQIPSGFGSDKIKETVQSTVNKIVDTAVGAVWKVAQEAVAQARTQIEPLVKKAIDEIVKVLMEFRDIMRKGFGDVVRPMTDKIGKPIDEFIRKYCEDLMNAGSEVLKQYVEVADKMNDALAKETEVDKHKFHHILSEFGAQVSWKWAADHKPTSEALNKFKAALFQDLDRINKITSMVGVNLNDIVGGAIGLDAGKIASQTHVELWKAVRDGTLIVQELMDLEVKADQKMSGSEAAEWHKKTMDRVMPKVILDIDTTCYLAIFNMFNGLTIQNMKKAIIPLIKGQVDPLDEKIPKDLKEFISIMKLVDQTIDDLLCPFIDNFIRHALEKMHSKLMDAAKAAKGGYSTKDSEEGKALMASA